jgi:hypothetical protein
MLAALNDIVRLAPDPLDRGGFHELNEKENDQAFRLLKP